MNTAGSRQPASEAELQGKYRQFLRVLMSYVDFEQAYAIASLILEQDLHARYPKENRILLEALNCSMIVAYCRPFSGNDSAAAYKVPDLPERFLRQLSEAEREIHDVVMADRNRVLAHSDSEAWNMRPHYVRTGRHDILLPLHNNVHTPLLREPTERLRALCEKMREAMFEERIRLEAELGPHLPAREPTT